jgi:hypothetical protein
VTDVRHVLRLAPDAVLGTEERNELPIVSAMEQIDAVAQIAGDTALIRNETDLLPGDRQRIIE